MNSTDLRILGNGQEFALMSQILDSQQMNGKHQPCPACGGEDRFRYIKNKDRFFCSGGGKGGNISGDWLSLLFHIHNDDAKKAFTHAKELLGIENDKVNQDELNEKRRLNDERKAKKAKQRMYRLQYDKRLSDELYRLEEMIGVRNFDKSPCRDEKELAEFVIDLIKERYRIE